jgi:hypothetical protein
MMEKNNGRFDFCLLLLFQSLQKDVSLVGCSRRIPRFMGDYFKAGERVIAGRRKNNNCDFSAVVVLLSKRKGGSEDHI